MNESDVVLATAAASSLSPSSQRNNGTTNPSRIIQVTNIAPQATKDQMHTLFSFIGRIEDIRLYPSMRDAGLSIASRVCFVKFQDPASVHIGANGLNNTVFIDRAIIVNPITSVNMPEEIEGLEMANSQSHSKLSGSSYSSESKFPPNISNTYEGNLIHTHDTKLELENLPCYPPLSATTTTEVLEEIRRTVTVSNLDSNISAQQCMEFFSNEAGEVKYFRYCTRSNDPIKYALIEFTEISSVINALKLNDQQLGSSKIKVTHATTSIIKPSTKSNEAAQKEIEEAMTKVKEAQSLVSAAVDPLMGMLGASVTSAVSGAAGVIGAGSVGSMRSRSRSRSRRRSRSRDRYSSRRSRSRDRRRRKRSRSRSRSRRRRSRSRSRDRRRHRSRSRKRSRSKDKNGSNDENGRNGHHHERRRSRSRSRSRKRSRSRDRKERRRSRSRDRKKRSRSRERRRRSRSRSRDRDRDRRSKKSSKETSKISRDYDQEERGFEKPSEKSKSSSDKIDSSSIIQEKETNLGTEDMEISNSP